MTRLTAAESRLPRCRTVSFDVRAARLKDSATASQPQGPRMNELSAYAVTHKWPARHPDRLQLYSLPTPNGVKVSIILEEIGLPYEPHLIDFGKGDQKAPEFLALNPNGKIPAIIDPNGRGVAPIGLFESGA